MKIFSNEAFISTSAAQSYATTLKVSHTKHMLPPDSPYFGGPLKMLKLEDTIGGGHVTGAGTFQQAMLQALDKVSDTHHFASKLQQQAIIDPDSVDIHDITVAQATAAMSLDITRNIMSRLVQSWRDLINTR